MSDTLNADIPARVAVLEQIARGTLATLERLEGKLDRMEERFEKRFEQVERKFERVDDKFDGMLSRMDTQFRWQLGIMLGTFGGAAGRNGARLSMDLTLILRPAPV